MHVFPRLQLEGHPIENHERLRPPPNHVPCSPLNAEYLSCVLVCEGSG